MSIERWKLTETLLGELGHDPVVSGLSAHPSLRELFVFYASEDVRFELDRDAKGCLSYCGYRGEAAICAFLEMGVTPTGKMTAATAALINQEHADSVALAEWLGRRIRKLERGAA